jgi:hypothetical protein
VIIVSQEKDGIINFDNILVIRLSTDFETNKKNIIYVDCVGDEHFGIGKYGTEERAKEVLQKIIRQKSIFEYFKNAPRDMQNSIADDFIKQNIIFDTYEMPEK